MKEQASGESLGGEEALIAARRDKASRVRARGENPYASDVERDKRTFVGDLRKSFESAKKDDGTYADDLVAKAGGNTTLVVFGRLVARRGFGKASFLRLRDGSGEIQLFAKQDVLGDDFARLEELDVGDHIEASGRAIVTKTGELSLELASIRLVTKAVRPLPDKWHGLSDVDLRYRRRYVDMVANPESAQVIAARALVFRGLRKFLDSRAFLEVETPSLHSLIGGAAARPFVTHHNTLDMELFLRIAPELYLKRLLVGGLERVYEIGRCYRNEGISTRHNPEFTMIELYMAYANYGTLMNLAEEMMRFVDSELESAMRERHQGELYETWRASRAFTLAEPFARVPMKDAILAGIAKAGGDPSLVEKLPAIATFEGIEEEAKKKGDEIVRDYAKRNERSKKIDWTNLRRALGHCETDGDRTFVSYEYLAEPFLAEDYRSKDGDKSLPVFVIDFPAEVSPLARRKDSEPSLVDRFELFVESREIANAFSELNDPEDQASRFRDQVERKSRGADETMDYDEDYIRALEHGMPPAAGFGMGIDRFLMMLTGAPSIRDVIAFPLLRPEGR